MCIWLMGIECAKPHWYPHSDANEMKMQTPTSRRMNKPQDDRRKGYTWRRRFCIRWETADSWRAADGLRVRFAAVDLVAVDLVAVDLVAVDLEGMCSEGVGSEFAGRCSEVGRVTAGKGGQGGSTWHGAVGELPWDGRVRGNCWVAWRWLWNVSGVNVAEEEEEEEEDNVLPTPIVRNARHCVPSDIFRPSLTTSPRSFLATLSFRERLRFSSWHINRRRSLANIGIAISLQLTSSRWINAGISRTHWLTACTIIIEARFLIANVDPMFLHARIS